MSSAVNSSLHVNSSLQLGLHLKGHQSQVPVRIPLRQGMDAAAEFRQFMNRIANLEDLHKVGFQNLVNYQQSLELFRREGFTSASSIISGVVTAAPSARLTKYMEDGGWHEERGRQVAAKLNSSFQGLLMHLFEARVMMLELEKLLGKANEFLLSKFSPSDFASTREDPQEDVQAHPEPTEMQPIDRRLQNFDYAQIMTLIFTMVEEDFRMQEKAVRALGLDTPSEALQSYTLMWSLRPFVNDSVIEQALSWI